MKSLAIIPLACVALAVAPPSRAQDVGDFTSVLATAAEGLGQGVGESIQGGQSVFVYARGRARLPVQAPDAYLAEVSANAPTAVEAAGQRDAIVQHLMAAAKAFGVSAALAGQSISLGENRNAFPTFIAPPRPGSRPAPAADDGEPPKPKFVATATVRFGEPADGKAPAFLDSLHQAGADSIASIADRQNNPLARAMGAMTGQADKVEAEPDQRVWDEALQDAVRNARAEAQTLAMAAGRTLGEARQILLVLRASDGKQATVTVAVRYGFGPAK